MHLEHEQSFNTILKVKLIFNKLSYYFSVLCEGCKMINGAGFNSHLSECDLFVHCYFGELGLRAIIRRCPFGQFWNQTILSCQYSERAYCPMGKFFLYSETG